MVKRRGVRVVAQRKQWDCGLACLAMLLNKPYGDISAAHRQLIHKKWHHYGLNERDLQRISRHFGVSLHQVKRKEHYPTATGILGIEGSKHFNGKGHWVVLKFGMVIDPTDSTVWTLDDYCKKWKCEAAILLKEKQP